MAKPRKVVTRGAKPAARKKVAPIPKGHHSVTPHIVCRGAAQAIEFYKKAFGAKEKARMADPHGAIMHAEITIGDSIVMRGEEIPGMQVAAPTIGGTTSGLFLYVTDVDRAFAQAVAAGATPDQPPADRFWGDRYGRLTDPFGHRWSMATHIEDVSMKAMKKRATAAMAPLKGGQAPKP